MKEGWKVLTIKECCDILDSRRQPITKSRRESGAIPYYGATGLLDYVKDYIFDEPLVLLGEDGAKWGAGECSAYRIEGKSWVNNHAHALRPKREVINDFWLIYFLNYSNLQSYITGVTVPKLNQEKMCSIAVPIPPLSEQQSIVDYLDSAFAKIDAMKANAEKALNEAKALFQASLKEMLEPKEGWEYKKLKDISYSISDGDWIEKKDQSDSGIRLIQTGNIGVGKFIPKDDSQKFITEETFKRLRCCEIFEGDILISRLPNPLGRSCILPKLDTRCITAVDCSIVRIKEEVILPIYFIYYTQSQGYFTKIENESSGTTRSRITRKKLEQTDIPIPPLSEQQSIVDYLDSLKSKVDQLQANFEKISQECDALKQAILKQVFE